jgi:DNA-binding transcriptional MerR regulator
MAYAIKELADLAGVTTRTLRYYDEIGVLAPAFTAANGYRYYDGASLLRLQQILFFRELDVP